jgi:hypothetical protein
MDTWTMDGWMKGWMDGWMITQSWHLCFVSRDL